MKENNKVDSGHGTGKNFLTNNQHPLITNHYAAIDGTFELCEELTGAEEIVTSGNSFFDRSYFGMRILILAPKPSDEILIAGNTILNFAAAKAEIFIAYKSKKNFNAEIIKSLGLKEEKIIFLGEQNFKSNLKKVILELQANIIFCADFDSQVEYKNFSADFEEVLGKILREEKNYRPEVYKKFACATALNSPPDFYEPNLISTVHPKLEVTDGYKFDLIDRANYHWQSRVRFPVPEICQKTLLKDNPVAKAIQNYKNNLSPIRILNGDEIFFERRTDNQALTAKVSSEKICDFKILDAEKNSVFTFDWAESVQVQKIVVYGNFLDDESAQIEINFDLDNSRLKIDSSGIFLDNKFKVAGTLPPHGLPLVFEVEKIFVKHAEIKILECGKNFGIGEVEFFANAEPRRQIQPFIKLTAGKNFFYTLFLPVEVEKISLGLYRFHVDEPVRISAESEEEKIFTEILDGGGEFVLNFNGANEIILTAEVVGNPNVYDRAIIRRVGDLGQIQFKMFQWLDKIAVAVK